MNALQGEDRRVAEQIAERLSQHGAGMDASLRAGFTHRLGEAMLAAKTGQPGPLQYLSADVIAHLERAAERNETDRRGDRSSNGSPFRVLEPGASGGESGIYVSDNGRTYESAVLGPRDSYAGFVRERWADGEESSVRLGAVMRAMITRPRTEAERNALSISVDSAGGYTVQPVLAAEWIDILRAQAVFSRAGGRTVPIVGETAFARLTADPTVAWKAENATVSPSDPTFGRLNVIPKTLIALVVASREVVEDSANIEDMIETSLAQSMAVELDRAAFFGSGIGSEPLGLKGTPGVGVIDFGDPDGNPLADYDPLLDARQLVLAANANEPTAYVMNPRTSTEIAKLKTGLTGDKTQLRRPAELTAPFLPTTSVPVDESQGTSVDASRIITGDFTQLWVAILASLRIELLREAPNSVNYQVGFLAHLRADVAVVRPDNFAMVTGIVPS
jgi:HK97 family phage major capsid protein